MATLADCRQLVRGFSGRLDPYQYSDSLIDQRINEFYTVDMATRLALEEESTPFSLVPQVGKTQFDLGSSFIRFDGNLTCERQNLLMFSEPSEFIYARNAENTFLNIGVGDGTTTIFLGTIGPLKAVEKSLKVISKVEVFSDIGIQALSGSQGGNGVFIRETGDFTVTFATAPENGEIITATWLVNEFGTPELACTINQQLLIWPSADFNYKVISGYWVTRKAPLVNGNDMFDRPEWLRYVAYGAAMKICEENGEAQTAINMIPFMEREKGLVLQRTTDELATSRAQRRF